MGSGRPPSPRTASAHLAVNLSQQRLTRPRVPGLSLRLQLPQVGRKPSRAALLRSAPAATPPLARAAATGTPFPRASTASLESVGVAGDGDANSL